VSKFFSRKSEVRSSFHWNIQRNYSTT